MCTFRALIISSLVFAGSAAMAQVNQQPDSIKIKSNEPTAVEIEASYPGGNPAWQNFLQKNLHPDVPVKNNAPVGKYVAMVQFIVDKDGSLSNIKPVTKFGYGMEEEVVRVIERSGKWLPATRNGVGLNAYRRQPITFLIDDDNFKITTAEPYTLLLNVDNEVSITARKIKPADISISVQGGKSTQLSDGKFNVRVTKPGRVTIQVVNNKKDDKEIGLASFEVIAK